MEPMIWSVIALLIPCGPIGFFISGLAFKKVQTAMAELPAGKCSSTARRNLKVGVALCMIGCALSLVLSIVAVVLKIMDRL